jgi:hypothetical protein
MAVFADRWNRYWFQPAPLLNLAITRIVLTGLQVIQMWVVLLPTVMDQLGADPSLYQPLPLLKLLTLSDFDAPRMLSGDVWVLLVWIAVISAFAACVGLFTNAALVVCAIASNMVHLFINSFSELHHPEAPMSIALVLLALSPCGRLLSVDSHWLRRGPPLRLDAQSEFAGWPLKLLMWMFALFYLSAVVAKMTSGGLGAWLNGFTLQYYLVMDGMRWERPVALWLAQHHNLVLLLQYLLVTFQATFWLAIIFPRLRWIYLPAGILIHASFWFILLAPFPQWIACYAAFIPWLAIYDRLRIRDAKRVAIETPS